MHLAHRCIAGLSSTLAAPLPALQVDAGALRRAASLEPLKQLTASMQAAATSLVLPYLQFKVRCSFQRSSKADEPCRVEPNNKRVSLHLLAGRVLGPGAPYAATERGSWLPGTQL